METTNDVCKRIKNALNKRSTVPKWTCRHGHGTAYGWLRIGAAPRYCTWHYVPKRDEQGREIMENGLNVYESVNDPSKEYGNMGPEDCAELARLLGLSEPVHSQGESVPASGDYHEEYVCRAEGKTPTRFGHQYWD
jgi:hypothetical protein